jgi:hypothetical protein
MGPKCKHKLILFHICFIHRLEELKWHQLSYAEVNMVLSSLLLRKFNKPVLVAHACNPSYSGGRDQEDRSSKPAQANSSRELHKNRTGGSGSK